MKIHRFIFNRDPNESSVSSLVGYYYSFIIQTGAYYQGYGRHTKEQVYAIGKADLRALNDIIGDNRFLVGSKPCDADASIFGVACQIMYHNLGPLHDCLISKKLLILIFLYQN